MENEKKGLNVSYSAIDTYVSCSEKYRLERILKIIPETIATPFFFGKAIDEASEVIFRSFIKGEKPYKRNEMLEKFKDKLTNVEHQTEIVYSPTSPLIKYSKADVDYDLLEKEDLDKIQEYLKTTDFIIDNIENFIEYYKDSKIKIPEEKLIYNYIGWFSLYRKGILLLDRLKKWADDNIIEVISIQKKIEIKNDLGDTLIGYLDLEARLKRDGMVRTLDLKTATNAIKSYPDDKIAKSMQLAIYAEATQKLVGYVVLDKDIKRKEPRVRVRELYGEITEEQLDNTFEEIDRAMNGIKAEKFEKNTEACWRFGKCAFYDLCHKNEMKGLVPRVSKEKKEKENV